MSVIEELRNHELLSFALAVDFMLLNVVVPVVFALSMGIGVGW